MELTKIARNNLHGMQIIAYNQQNKIRKNKALSIFGLARFLHVNKVPP
jgi:hypothetical protein